MTALPPILKFSALSWPIPVGVGAAMDLGTAATGTALAAAIAGVVMLGNIAVYVFAGPRFVRSIAADEGGGLWGAMLLLKSSVVLLLVIEMATRLSPQGVALGLCPLLLGTVGAAVFAKPSAAGRM
jgi:uncharacterized membrane-anchored protein